MVRSVMEWYIILLFRQFFIAFTAQQQRAHEHRFTMSRTTPHIISVFWDHDKAQSLTHPALIDALNYLRPSHDTKLYQLLIKAWNKVTIALLQRARNVKPFDETLCFNHIRSSKRHAKGTRAAYPIPEPCGLTLVQTILPAHLYIQDQLTRPPLHPCTPLHSEESPANMIDVNSTRSQILVGASSLVGLSSTQYVRYSTTS